MSDKDALRVALDKLREGLSVLEGLGPMNRQTDEVDCRAAAERFLHASRLRRRSLPRLTGDPGWELLATLYVAQVDRRELATAEAITSVGVPPTTGLRWIERLESEGLVSRASAPEDRRKKFLQLTPTGTASVEDIFRKMG